MKSINQLNIFELNITQKSSPLWLYQHFILPRRHFQKSGTTFTIQDIVEWAKRPLPGKDIFLVGEAFGPERAWCQGAIVSAQHALREGWAIDPGSHGGGYYEYHKYHLHDHHDTTS